MPSAPTRASVKSTTPPSSFKSPPPTHSSSPAHLSSRLDDLLGLADDSRALNKLSGDYGLDVASSPSPSASATNAMRFLRSLKTSYPEILLQNEELIIATGSSDEEDLRGRQLYPLKDVSRAPQRDSANRSRISPHWHSRLPREHQFQNSPSYTQQSPAGSTGTTSWSNPSHFASSSSQSRSIARETRWPEVAVPVDRFDDFDEEFDDEYEDDEDDEDEREDGDYYDDDENDEDIISSFASLSKLSSHVLSTSRPAVLISSRPQPVASRTNPQASHPTSSVTPPHIKWYI